MKTNRRLHLSCLLSGLCLLSSCAAPKQQASAPRPATQESSEPQLANDMSGWMTSLRDQVAGLTQIDHQLPGRDNAEHRKLMADFFGSLTQVLPSLHGPTQTGQFNQQMRTIQTARVQLSSGSADLASEPTVDYGLRAAASALGDIIRGNSTFADHPEFGQDLDQLQQKIDQLDVQRGPLHRHLEGDAADSIVQIVQRMSNLLGDKISPTTGPSGQSAAGGGQ